MRASPGRAARLPGPLGAALDDELRRIEGIILRTWQGLAACGVVGSVAVGWLVSPGLALWTGSVSVAAVLWFTAARGLWEHGRGGRWLIVSSTAVESALPWISLLVEVKAQGAAYALGSWVPPMLFSALLLTSAVRLRPMTSLVVGAAGAAAFLLIYFTVVRHGLSPEEAAEPLYRQGTQVTRAGWLVTAGLFGAVVARGLRGVIGRAESAVREKDLFGKYRILREVASGGMGTVHQALYCPEGGFERLVAIKRIHPHLAEKESFVRAFRDEASLSARLVHPNVVQVFDFGRVGATYFLAMEYVDGLTLASFLRRTAAMGRSLPPSLVAHLGCEILAGLDYAHTVARAPDGRRLHVIHRDVCPANILLSRAGEVKLSDFGVARALFEAAAGDTRTVAGHMGYMAPEQARNHPFDERSDLFGVGVILWELLVGKRLFFRGTEAATVLALMSDHVVPVTLHLPELEPAWDAVLARALERAPERRFASAVELSAALAPLRAHGARASEELARWVGEALALAELDAASSDELDTQLTSGPSSTPS